MNTSHVWVMKQLIVWDTVSSFFAIVHQTINIKEFIRKEWKRKNKVRRQRKHSWRFSYSCIKNKIHAFTLYVWMGPHIINPAQLHYIKVRVKNSGEKSFPTISNWLLFHFVWPYLTLLNYLFDLNWPIVLSNLYKIRSNFIPLLFPSRIKANIFVLWHRVLIELEQLHDVTRLWHYIVTTYVVYKFCYCASVLPLNLNKIKHSSDLYLKQNLNFEKLIFGEVVDDFY